MLKILELFSTLRMRWYYPVSLPADISLALGIDLPQKKIAFEDLMRFLISPKIRPKRLKRFMPREKAEAVFNGAVRKDVFAYNSVYSYYFRNGWLEFILQFDNKSRLRRIYVQHKDIYQDDGVEINLNTLSA
ncbi:MAG: hypothetical protein HN411_04140 [Waddliaceae bacterium]|jgi:hypothetical protein|nr:hypothetical protein [Waddliaceae bacterium]MBT3578779.1 hypothetical protein [Waddliaceae bacterium]MBT4445322.1 hypothetical protein [Waddliaceae bacterium]MBT6928618.1 hypothetical protein [Waddliaceae bacterium]MBT7265118.1 hypothetical protein [Waddliaceae bacterium]